MQRPSFVRRRASALRNWFKRDGRSLAVMLVLLAVARTSFANHYVVPSGSMEDTLMPGDRVIVDMSAYGVRVPFTGIALVPRGTPQRGDIVVLKSPADGTRLIKRVAAIGGDTVALHDGHLTVNGRALAVDGDAGRERFGARIAALNLDAGGGGDIDRLRIPEGRLLLLGDHRGNSADGRYFGLVDSRAPYARAVAVYYRSGAGLVWKRL